MCDFADERRVSLPEDRIVEGVAVPNIGYSPMRGRRSGKKREEEKEGERERGREGEG